MHIADIWRLAQRVAGSVIIRRAETSAVEAAAAIMAFLSADGIAAETASFAVDRHPAIVSAGMLALYRRSIPQDFL